MPKDSENCPPELCFPKAIFLVAVLAGSRICPSLVVPATNLPPFPTWMVRLIASIPLSTSIRNIVDYHTHECVEREIKMRRRKNCGRYFVVTGHAGIEYCDRPFDEKGRACKEIGTTAVWIKK